VKQEDIFTAVIVVSVLLVVLTHAYKRRRAGHTIDFRAAARAPKAVLRVALSAGSILVILVAVLWAVGFGALYIFEPAEYYAYHYDVPVTDVIYDKEPHDCEFNVPPMGKKYCHYDKSVSVKQGNDGHRYVYIMWTRVQD
jgi:hypothetical protein